MNLGPGIQLSIFSGGCLNLLSRAKLKYQSHIARGPRREKMTLMSYTDSPAPDQPSHPRSLIRELHCSLIMQVYSKAGSVAFRSDSEVGPADLELHCPHKA